MQALPRQLLPRRHNQHKACKLFKRHARLNSVACSASKQPCILITGVDHREWHSAEKAAEQVRALTGCHVVVAHSDNTHHASTSTNKTVRVEPGSSLDTYHVNATPLEAVLVMLDSKQGLLPRLNLNPVLCICGPFRGHALSSAADTNQAVAAARHAAVMGIPSMAVCLATSSLEAPMQPAIDAMAQLVPKVLATLQTTGGWPQATNHPRAHFPFPQRGRWALGRELAWPDQALAQQEASAAGLREHADCWALGEDASWLGGWYDQNNMLEGNRLALEQDEALGLIQSAFAEGDIFLNVNVPPTWIGTGRSSDSNPTFGHNGNGSSASPAFASTRCGVLWHLHQVEMISNSSYNSERSHSSKLGSSNRDVWGRSLPSQNYGTEQHTAGMFVDQDNTAMVVERAGVDVGFSHSDTATLTRGFQGPIEFSISRGTVLNDHAARGDVEAVFQGRVAVTSQQTWPDSHPFALRDELLVHSLRESPEGLPLWLCS